MPSVSIIIPCLNEQETIRKLLEAIHASAEHTAQRLREIDTVAEKQANQAARVAGALHGLGVGAGDTVLLFLRNRPEFHVADLGALLLRNRNEPAQPLG